jgi:[acyl-carrier-protein] S-malonyltransferase
MMDRTALIFPGQGVQVVGMGKALAEAFPPARAVFEQANEILGLDLRSLCFNGPVERLSATDVQQPAIFATSLAIWEVIRTVKPAYGEPQAIAGLSLGEYMALVVAGTLSFGDGLRLVQHRGRLMQQASQATPSGMTTIIGLDRQAAQSLVDEARQDGVLVAANFLAKDLIVVSGERQAIDRIGRLAEARQARLNPLDVAGAFHSPLMAPAAKALGDLLAGVQINPPRIPVVSNVTGDYHGAPSEIRSLLQEQVVRPVEWAGTIERLVRDGFRRMIAVGPGASQRTIIRRLDRSLDVLVVDSPADIEKL